MIFQLFKNDKEIHKIVSVIEGNLIPIEEVNDPIFSKKMLGDGVAFQTTDKIVKICSPADGKVTVLFPTHHAFGIKTKDGIELLVHIGIDTVEAKGEGFHSFVNQGDTVRASQPIIEVEMDKMKEKYDMSIMLIVTNSNNKQIKFIDPQKVKVGQNIERKD